MKAEALLPGAGVCRCRIAPRHGLRAGSGQPCGRGRLVPTPAWRRGLALLCLLALIGAAPGADLLTTAFDQANKLYEERKFAEAAAAYEKLIQSGYGSATLYYNLGNAFFKDGQHGRALAAYRAAEPLAPRDPNLRFNLQFVRKQVTGSDAAPGAAWRQWLANLTLNEWSVLAMCAWWLWLLLLALREARPALRRALSGYTATAGVVTAALAVCLVAAVKASRATEAIVSVPNAVVRQGPLETSPVAYQLRDGSEVAVLDEKELSGDGPAQSWLQVRHGAQRPGWLKRDQVVVLGRFGLNPQRKGPS